MTVKLFSCFKLPSSLDLLFRGIGHCLCLHGDDTSSSLSMAGPWSCYPHWGLTSPGPFGCFTGTSPLKNTHHVLNTEAKNLFLVFILLDVSMLFALLISGYLKSLPPTTSETPALLLSSTWHRGGPSALLAPWGWPVLTVLPMVFASLQPTLYQIHLFLQMLKVPARGAPSDCQRNASLGLTSIPWLLSFCLPGKFSSFPLLHLLKSDLSFKAQMTHCPLTSVSK